MTWCRLQLWHARPSLATSLASLAAIDCCQPTTVDVSREDHCMAVLVESSPSRSPHMPSTMLVNAEPQGQVLLGCVPDVYKEPVCQP